MSDAQHEPVAPGGGRRRRPSVRTGILFYLVLLLLAGVVAWGLTQVIASREARLHAQEQALATDASAGLPVRVTTPKLSGDSLTMLLPGDVRAYLESPIHAKVSGYLKQLSVDKGDRVEAGQVLAVLESPEAEQEYRTAQANYEIAKITSDRNHELARQQIVSQQAADQARADFLMAQSNLQRLKVLLDYQRLRAPFAGVVVARNYDPGVLVPAATTSTSAASAPVLVIAKIDRLRVYVYVPQSDATFVRIGDPAEISFEEFPGRVFKGRVSRFARALDAGTRTMLTEIDLSNGDQRLLPGMYARVSLTRRLPQRYPIVPDEALVFQNEKVFVPVLMTGNRIHLQPVTLGVDNGTEVQVTSGLTGTETIALGVGQTVAEGLLVQPVEPKAPAAGPPAAPGARPGTAGPPASSRPAPAAGTTPAAR